MIIPTVNFVILFFHRRTSDYRMNLFIQLFYVATERKKASLKLQGEIKRDQLCCCHTNYVCPPLSKHPAASHQDDLTQVYIGV